MVIRTVCLSTALATATFFACACTSKQITNTSHSTAPALEQWSINLTVDGGLAGISQRFSVDSATQSFSAYNEADRSTVSRQLTPPEAEQLAPHVFAPDSESKEFGNANCADCIRYTLTIERADQQQRVHHDSLTLPGSRYELLISKILLIGNTLFKEKASTR